MEIESYDVWLDPFCLQCEKEFSYEVDSNMVVCSCDCKKDVVLTLSQWSEVQNMLNPIPQTLFLNGKHALMEKEPFRKSMAREKFIEEFKRWTGQ